VNLSRRDVVLLGVGHTNAHVVRMWQRHAPRGARLTCVSNNPVATYSGMLPGVLAGQYPQERMEIDLARLSAAAGAGLMIADVTGLDVARQELLFADRPPLRFDVLSIGIGSIPAAGDLRIADAARLLPIKPMQTFIPRLDDALRDAASERHDRSIRVVIVGGGAGGVELTLCLPPHLRALLGGHARFDMTLVTADERLVPGSLEQTARRVERIFERRGVRLLTGRQVVQVDAATVALDDRTVVDADVILWATGAAAPGLLARLGLPTDTRGFLLTSDLLQITSGAPIFAVGDTGTVAGASIPKAGVYAVRQGPVLWDNILRTLSGSPLRQYVPQQGFLKLLNTGDGRAIGEWHGLSFEGAWCWWLKDYIDSRFVEKYRSGAVRAVVRS
jgi:pyridine nucleotide-disulfide oxidoreductase family protein